MKCIDFDKKFALYTSQWVKAHAREYKNMDAMEADMPKVYDTFLNTPADWLAGQKPGEYFAAYSDAKTLVDWMEDYIKQGVPLPDVLPDRIAELGEDAAERLFALCQKERAPLEARMIAVTLLREIGSTLPLRTYIDWQLAREEDDELCDNALDSLTRQGEPLADVMLDALERASDTGRDALLSVLCHHSRDARIARHLLALFAKYPEKRAVIAGELAMLGDETALDALMRAAADEDTPYLDYIEMRAAIEALGGEAPERAFDETDPAYEAVRALQDKPEHDAHQGHCRHE